ncbi:MAG: PEP-CTERM sorting domain-containing protein [Bryobacterales bacterium]|nr:PEP-CTERM sorting domain-containing protein [Bryobacterales bacterium]
MKRCFGYGVLVLCGLFAAHSSHAETIVYPNAPGGDAYTNAFNFNQGQAVGSSGWYYNNVRGSGAVGISAQYPNDSTGSVKFSSPSGSGKADIEYLANPVNGLGNFYASGSLGLLSDLSSMSYSWYRDGSSNNPALQHPVLRVLVDADGDLSTIIDRGGLVFEGVYNGSPVATTNTWVSNSIAASTFLWNFGLGIGSEANINATPYAYDATLADWQAYFPNAAIIGFNSGFGGGWNGTFTGAVDKISWTIGDVTTSTNFELQAVPEPSSLLLSMAGAALLFLRRRKARR